ncbi:N-acetylmuramoyl-L-alanine amidase [Thiocystis violascens]|uniref:Negative regulator of beta-lactamase expression n=1 Tax=Thiocystis violascens (strain ATCC 17096 / DSM 198 / 6111) TaxID=765911 RepID=I3YGV1_THIV6|nr:N-acetylmuramoyl-L-alanine amidase [Thiocystis violascens]AFL76219.1 negative regulator of beta-lactamase expression [Thiocystis violascens DSM 198]
MNPRPIDQLIIHCSDSRNGRWIDAESIDHWHAERGFLRAPEAVAAHEPTLRHLGHHWLIYTNGSLRPGRHPDEPGAPRAARGHQALNLCLIGRDAFTPAQWTSLAVLVDRLLAAYPQARVLGHRDSAPEGWCESEGVRRRCPRIQTCPGFDVAAWLAGGRIALPDHLLIPREDCC